MVSSMIAQKGFVEIPFKQYFAFQNVHSGSSRFTVATQSLDRVWMAHGHATTTLPKVRSVPGYSDAWQVQTSCIVYYFGAYSTGAAMKA